MCLSIGADAICCAGSSICSLACCCCKACFGTTFKEQVKLTYILLNTIVMIMTVIALYYLQELYSSYVKLFGCPIQSGGSDKCLGVSGVYRMSFTLCCMYFVLMFCMLFRGRFAKEVNEGFWALKLMMIGGVFYGSLYIPNEFFEGYVTLCILMSGIYMVFQIVMFVDIFYMWAENWVKQYDEGMAGMAGALITATSFMYIGTLILVIYNFIWFDSSFWINLGTVVLMAILLIVQIQGYNPSGSLLTSAAVSLYIAFQSYSAQSSLPEFNGNPFYYSSGAMVVQMIFGFIFNIIALIYLIFATQETSSQKLAILETQQDKKTNVQPIEIELTYDQQVKEAKALIDQDELLPYQTNQYVVFHIVMLITAMYMAMMITNWGAPTITDRTIDAYKPSWVSYYVKLGASWVAGIVYLWSLLAPVIFPDRQFI